MNKIIAMVMVAGAAVVAAPAIAADIPYYPPVIDLPDVDYGVQGSFYLRGSAAANTFWTKEITARDCACDETVKIPVVDNGFGYSLGAGVGYETGTGLRFDVTVDYLDNDKASVVKNATFNYPGEYKMRLRSTLALANVYYDFSLGGNGQYGYSAAGGAFGYVGAGAGVAFNKVDVTSPNNNPIDSGTNTSFAAAGMVGVGYDFGTFTADVGYRGVYVAEVTNNANNLDYFSAKDNWIHEVRTTLRYRFN